jgi:hypothetical protein
VAKRFGKDASRWILPARNAELREALTTGSVPERFANGANVDLATAIATAIGPLVSGQLDEARVGELIDARVEALEWRDIDFERGLVTVARSAWKEHTTAPKSGRIRHVGVTRRVLEALREAQVRSSSKAVLVNRQGEPMTQKEVQGVMRRVSRAAGVTPGVHILRHTFCSRLAASGVPARTIQELAGHQDLATTQRYMHLSPASLESAVQALEKVERSWRRREPGSKGPGSIDESWWRRRESNPRPKARRRGTLHACPLLKSRARRVEAAKYRQAPDPANLTRTRRVARCAPACLMASDPQAPGKPEADVTA